MNEKELRKLLTEKQKEMEAAQREYELVHYSRQLSVFGEVFEKSPDVLELIQKEDLTYDDCKLLANVMAKKIRGIYKNFAEMVSQNQTRRKNKNLARYERRHNSDKPATYTISGTNPSTAAGTSSVTPPLNQQHTVEHKTEDKERQY